MQPDEAAIAPARFLVVSNHTEGDSWIDVLGTVAYNFGRLEGVSYEIVLAYEPQATRSKWMRAGFTDRSAHAMNLLEASLRPFDAQLADDWRDFWAGVVTADVAGIRNQVLHNPLSVGINAMDRFPEGQGIRLVREPGTPLMPIDDAIAFSATLADFSQRMDALLARTSFT